MATKAKRQAAKKAAAKNAPKKDGKKVTPRPEIPADPVVRKALGLKE